MSDASVDPSLLPQDADLLARVMRVKVTRAPPSVPHVMALADLAGELTSEQAASGGGDPLQRWVDMSQRRSLVDRAFISLLSQAPTNGEPAPILDRLAACFQRALDERRRLKGLKTGSPPEGSLDLVEYMLELCTSYSVMGLVNPELFPQPSEAAQQGPERLLVLLDVELGITSSGGPGLPSGFLMRLVDHAAAEGMIDELAGPILGRVHERAKAETILTNYTAPLRLLVTLLECKPVRTALVTHPHFMPTAAAPLPQLPPQLLALAASLPRPPAPGAPPNGRAYEESMLGPFLRPSGFPPESVTDMVQGGRVVETAAQALFSGVSKRTRAQVNSSLDTLRAGARTLAQGLEQAIKFLLKTKEVQPRVFDWLGGAIASNSERAKEWYIYGQGPGAGDLASLGFVYNLTFVLVKLCSPFVDPASPKVANIDGTFLLSSHRFDCSKDTKLCASEDALMHWLDPRNEDARARYMRHMASEARESGVAESDAGGGSERGEGSAEAVALGEQLHVSDSFGTISEFFFCALRALHVGVMPAFAKLGQLDQQHYRLHREVRRLRESSEDPSQLQQLEDEADKLAARRLCLEAHLNDPHFTGEALHVFILAMGWLLRLLAEGQGAAAGPPKLPDGGDAPPGGGVGTLPLPALPLQGSPPRVFACQPEHVLDDAVQFVKHMGRYDPAQLEGLTDQQLALILTFAVTFLGAPRFVRNPYLRAHLTEVLALFVPRKDESAATGYSHSRMQAVLAGHATARRWLAPYLMGFFVDIEFTGSHTQFHDKFTYRHHMAVVLEHLWTMPEYRQSIVSVAEDAERFVRFNNFILNDALYCMDEALLKLSKIREVQQLMLDRATWEAMPKEEQDDKTSQLRAAEEQGGYYMQLANEIVHMLLYLSSEERIVNVFMRPELVARVSMMLNHFVLRLVGPNCLELKVTEPDKYHFYPRDLLAEIGQIYLHFAHRPEFPPAVVADQRSYKPELFPKAVNKVLRYKLNEEQLIAFNGLVRKCAEAAAHEVQLEEDLGETPDEFACGITYELMSDPVLLPSSQVHVDRAAITRHLLSDETDPFNRSHLTADMLQTDEELKAKIQAWRAERLAHRNTAGGGGAAMQVDG